MLKDKDPLEDFDLFEELDGKEASTYVGGTSLNPANLLNLISDVGATWDTWNTDTYELAIGHSQRMCNEGNIHHKGFSDRADLIGGYVAENVAYASTDQEAFNMWMNSSGHRNNMLNPIYNEVGVGIWQCPDGYKYYTAIFHG